MKWFISLISIFLLLILGCKLSLPNPPLLQEISFSKTVYDDQHQLLRITLTSDEKYRLYTPLEEISPLLVQTTLLQEDQYFFQHLGFNPVAIIKAAWQTYILRTRPYGASTITMQLARILDDINSKHINGKLWQILKAMQLELLYSKKQILEAYLNLVSYGGNIEGIGAASTIYFSKTAKELNLLEALRLSVVPQNPSRRVPTTSLQQDWQKASDRLFQRWIEHHPKDKAIETLMNLPLPLTKKHLPFLAPHFVDKILQNNPESATITTLNLKLQTLIENVSYQYLEKEEKYGIKNAAVMLVDMRDMEVKAMVGSGNYFDATIHGQVNGTKAKRSPGSTLKPLIYALALDQGIIHPYTVLKDTPSTFADYNPENFDTDYLGPIKAKEALVLSRNIPAIYLAEQLKNPTLYQLLQQAQVSGLKSEQNYGLSLVLGSAEMTMEELVGLYAMLGNFGIWKPLRTCTEQHLSEGTRLLSQEASFLTLDMLRDTPRPYPTNSSVGKQIEVYWKTGTSSGYRDAWSIGIFGPYVLAVWIGDFNNQSNPAYVGATAAAPLFFTIVDVVNKHFDQLPDVIKATPQMNLTKVKVCETSGLLPTPYCPNTVSAWFIPGKSPIKTDHIHQAPVDSKIYEFWPSDLLSFFNQAGMQRHTPPPLYTVEGEPPQIISPQQNLVYTVPIDRSDHSLLFSATSAADVTTLYWFVDNQSIGSCDRDHSLPWQTRSGTYTVRVIDNHGRTAIRNLVVQAYNTKQN